MNDRPPPQDADAFGDAGRSSSVSLDELRRSAEEALKRQFWEAAIEHCHAALKMAPNDGGIRMALGHAYEGKSREKDAHALLLMAMEQYRHVLKLEPRNVDAHDALLAAATKAGALEELLAEYRVRLRRDPDNDACRAAFRKIETLLIMKTDARKESGPEPHRITWILLDRALPFLALACLIGSFIVRLRNAEGSALSSGVATALLRSSLFMLAVYIAYKVSVRR